MLRLTDLRHGLTEPGASPCTSNVVFVQKKDGSFRLYVDYMRLNSVTYKDSYPLLPIDTCLGSINGCLVLDSGSPFSLSQHPD